MAWNWQNDDPLRSFDAQWTEEDLDKYAASLCEDAPITEEPCRCPCCGEVCQARDFEPGGAHYIYQDGRLAGYCEQALAEMTDQDLGYPED